MLKCMCPKDRFAFLSLPDFSSSQEVFFTMVYLQSQISMNLTILNLKTHEHRHLRVLRLTFLDLLLKVTLAELPEVTRSKISLKNQMNMTTGSSQTSISFVTTLSTVVLCACRTRRPAQFRPNGWTSCAPRSPTLRTWAYWTQDQPDRQLSEEWIGKTTFTLMRP